MTDIKKTPKGKNPKKSKKLQLNKETLTDLGAKKPAQVRGGGAIKRCTEADTGCPLDG